MKILIIVDGMLSGGAERQIIELLKGIRRQSDISMGLCTLSVGGERERQARRLVDFRIPVTAAKNAGADLLMSLPLIAVELVRACRRERPDIVHTYGCFSDFLGALLKKWLGIRFINGSIRAARPRLSLRDRIGQLTFGAADVLVANSHAGLRAFGLTGGVVIHNGVDLGRFQHLESPELSGSPILCMVGNFTDKKDQKSLISCLPEIVREFPDTCLVLIGRGKNIHSCKMLTRELGCEKNLLFIEDCDNPEPYLAASDICYLLSNVDVHGEGISNAIIEYMAMGKPVIASDCGGNGELVTEGVTGVLIRRNDPAQIIAATMELLKNPAVCHDMGRAGRRKIEQDFSIQRLVESYVTLYRSCLDLKN